MRRLAYALVLVFPFLFPREESQAGHFYANIVLTPADQDAVVSFLKKRKEEAYVSPAYSNCVVVYERNCDDHGQDVLKKLAEDLSKAIGCTAITFLNHDDDVLWVAVYSKGKLEDEYDSAPGYFDGSHGKPSGGNATRICKRLGQPSKAEKLEGVLRSPDYTIEAKRHQQILKILSLPNCSAGYGFKYLATGLTPDDFRKFKRTP